MYIVHSVYTLLSHTENVSRGNMGHRVSRLCGRPADVLDSKSCGQGFDSWTWQGEESFSSSSKLTPVQTCQHLSRLHVHSMH